MGNVHGDAVGELRSDAPTGRLQSWKELAAYLKRGARTLQRWEREEGLPVRRLPHAKQGSIYAYKSELDAWWTARGAELSPAPGTAGDPARSVAVMPFADLSPRKDQTYFCEGIVEEIVHALSQQSGLRSTSHRNLRLPFVPDGRPRGRQTEAWVLLEGSVRKSADQWRIAVQLVDGESGMHIWSNRYDRPADDVFGVQEEVAGNIARAVAATLRAGGDDHGRQQPFARERALECYRRGREFYYQCSPGVMEFAIHLFVRAIETDPGFAEGWAGLADCWSFACLHTGASQELREQADWASLHALEIDPHSAQAHASRGLALSLDGRDREARRAYEAAIRLDPGLFEAYSFYARHCFASGELAEAADLYAKASEARSDDYQAPVLVGQVLSALGRNEEAMAAWKLGVRRAEEHLKWNPDDARALYLTAHALAAMGETSRASQFIERALAIRPGDPVLLYHVACTFALMGMTEPAIEALENAARNGLDCQPWDVRDSNLDGLRKHPRFD